MTHYAVGDIQGCYQELRDGLDALEFDYDQDTLWVAGDLINRGPDSAATLDFLYQHRHCLRCVLGNHDLHFLARYFGQQKAKRSDTLNSVLTHKDCDKWVEWLRQQALFIHDEQLSFSMVHAGVAPSWTLSDAISYSTEIEQVLQSDGIELFLANMYGNEPKRWDPTLTGHERLRCITNHFTRIRSCNIDGDIDLQYKGDILSIPEGYLPWFSHPQRKTAKQRIIFGHWAALGGHIDNNVFGLDSGCVWGLSLSFLQMDSLALTTIPAASQQS